MINDASLARFEPLGTALLKPIYADYSFGNIPNTIHFMLTGEQRGPLLPADCFGGSYPSPEKIVLIFVDAFGWKSWQAHLDRFATTRRVAHDGVLTPISALFPSTTAASVTTMNFGVLPAVHALYEWNVYIPAYGEVIQTLPFAPLGSHRQDSCLEKGFDPAARLAVSETAHQRLAARGVRSLQFSHRSYSGSTYNHLASAGAEIIAHSTLAEGLVQLKDALADIRGKAWLTFYWASIDTVAHAYGPGSRFHDAEIAGFWAAFDAILGGLNSPDTLFLFIADHDQVGARREDTIYINERLPQIADCLPVSHTGHPIYPNGSPRDLFLHLKPERKDEVLSLLRAHFGDIAHIITVDAALEIGLFGPGPFSPELRPRLGDVLVLPHDGYFIGWREPGLMENRFNGHHGGLAAGELITVIGAIGSL